jgi:hypothetical protein
MESEKINDEKEGGKKEGKRTNILLKVEDF